MSFSADIKRAICKTEYECSGCRRAELAGFFVFSDKIKRERISLGISAPDTAARVVESLSEELGIAPEKDGRQLVITGAAAERMRASVTDDDVINKCCAVSYIRGAFLSSGSVSDPQKEYHLEFSTVSGDEAAYLVTLLTKIGFKPKRTRRKGRELIYIKESAQIAELIGYMSGGRAGLEIFSILIEKDMKSSAQRQVNCDSANLNKQARASAAQIAAIKKIKAAHKWHKLPQSLRDIGELRLRYPDESIEALGKVATPPIGKSGVNHRFQRIIAYADALN